MLSNQTGEDQGSVCQVTTADGSCYRAKSVIVSVPLSVLHRGSINFQPPLPSRITRSLADMHMGGAVKIYLTFDRCWWPEDLGILYCSQGFFPQYWVDQTRVSAAHSEHCVSSKESVLPDEPCPKRSSNCTGNSPPTPALQAWRNRLIPIASLSKMEGRNGCNVPDSTEDGSPMTSLASVGVTSISPSDIRKASQTTGQAAQLDKLSRCEPHIAAHSVPRLYSLFAFATGEWADDIGKHPPAHASMRALLQLDAVFG